MRDKKEVDVKKDSKSQVEKERKQSVTVTKYKASVRYKQDKQILLHQTKSFFNRYKYKYTSSQEKRQKTRKTTKKKIQANITQNAQLNEVQN